MNQTFNYDTVPIELFTRRELEVMELNSQGKAQKEIGYNLGIAASTVNNHMRAIFHKTGLSKALEIAKLWYHMAGVTEEDLKELRTRVLSAMFFAILTPQIFGDFDFEFNRFRTLKRSVRVTTRIKE